ncbi:hypothetical protein AS149_31745 [Burkholderia cenocepacia]|nr:hypothetical protein AS149_31745 [Burkholderia cenocepacia]
MVHTCHAKGCAVPVHPEKLMCGRHWRMVPRRLQLAVWRHYRAGQCEDKSPSREWLSAAHAAIDAVAALETSAQPTLFS